MYKLNTNILNYLKKNLKKYHELFDYGRCSGWQLEELIVKSIKQELDNADAVKWSGNNHKIEYDILINNQFSIQIKSGEIKKESLIISGYRLGRYNGDLDKITSFLNNNKSFIMAFPYQKSKSLSEQKHVYKILYLPKEIFKINNPKGWKQEKKSYILINDQGVKFKIHPSMSWQIWWEIPLNLIKEKNDIIKIK